MGRKDKSKDSINKDKEPDEAVLSKLPGKRKPTAGVSENGDEIPKKKVKKHIVDDSIVGGTTSDQVPGIVLKRQEGKRAKKRRKREEALKKSKDLQKERTDIREYLNCWSAQREKWKFQKLKQIIIQRHILDESHIDAETWPIALEYVSAARGVSRTILIKTAETAIQTLDAAAEENNDDSLHASSKYKRARELLQSLG
ncbi:uncharacterized protein C7orf50 homolog [Anopheles bellator]|uniref:uncharacterized protein C7orf50 homolog n=1 Tax=Anopheles bellator TaxID=139047 RepID=UPI00264833A9|nr:uncharacterized protein C7orf50 homolog [Anopheles bellator]